MNPSNPLALMRDRAPSAEFYLRPPIRNRFFIFATSMLSMELLVCALLLAGGWRHLTVLTILFIDIDDERAHGRDERVAVESFFDGVEFYYRLVIALSSSN